MMNKRKAKILLVCIKIYLLLIVSSCQEPVPSTENVNAEIITKDSSGIYLSKSKINQWISAKNEDEQIKLVQEFLKNSPMLLEQEMDSNISRILPIIEVEKFYQNEDYLVVLIGNLNEWEVSFLVLAFNGKHYKVMHHEMVNSHYSSPKIEQLKENFLSLEHETGGGTDFLEKHITVYYLDTVEQKILSVLAIPNIRNSWSYLKYEITPYVEYSGAYLKVQMDYKFRFCDILMGDSMYSFETVKKSYEKFRFWNCQNDESIVLLDDSNQFHFEWIPAQKQFALKNGNESIWKLFEQFNDNHDINCDIYHVFGKDIKEFNPQNTLAIERLIKLCELKDE